MAVRTVRRQAPGQDVDALIVVVNQLVTLANELKTDFAAVLAKLDLDATVTDTNYGTTGAIAAAAADSIVVTY